MASEMVIGGMEFIGTESHSSVCVARKSVTIARAAMRAFNVNAANLRTRKDTNLTRTAVACGPISPALPFNQFGHLGLSEA
jgi:hypothetical protein